MRYAQAIERLFAMQSRGIRMGVSRMAEGLRFRGHPQRGQRFVHVAGTNGKGSVATMLATGLSCAGYRVGLFTSPHLHRYVERVRIAGRPIGQREAATRIGELLAAFERPGAPETTFFELTTLLAIEAFADHGCDVAVLEVGLGGRLDATNAVGSELTVITNVGLDHTGILGDSLEAIAGEKAGILKPGVPAVVGARERAARAVIARRARRVGADVSLIGRDFEVAPGRGDRSFDLSLEGQLLYRGLRVALRGPHQLDNAACAALALHRLRERGFDVPATAIARGIGRARWPGRIERIPGHPDFLLDAAHNPDGCAALGAFLRDHDPWRRRQARTGRGRRVLVFGAMRDKDCRGMLARLLPLFDTVYYSAPAMRRACGAAELARRHRGKATRSVDDALARARRSAGRDGQVVVAGSLFLIAQVRARLLGVSSDPLIRM